MFTRCPECQTTFRITVAQLKMRDGLVRCGRCDAVFRADLRLFATLAAASEGSETITPPEPAADEHQPERRKRKRKKKTLAVPEEAPAEIPTVSDFSIFFPKPKRLVH